MDSSDQNSNKRIAKNTIFLYVRMFITMIVGLYTSRIVLQVLGTSDYGLYTVVGGLMSMFTMFSGALTIGTQRFLSIAMGERDEDKLKRIFSLALGLHIAFAIFIFILAETIGLWVLNTQLNIPAGRETAVFWVYQFTIVGFCLVLMQVPFQSCIISHENMGVYAYMSIYDVVMKLLVVILIQYITFDKLILYSAFVLAVGITSTIIYNIYCRCHYKECTFRIRWDAKLAKEIGSYSGWNLIGESMGLFTNQGVNILLNIFCGTVVNAARGLAETVNSLVNAFVFNFQIAVNPQIVKRWAAKEYDQLYRLVINNGRVAEYLFLFIAIPAFIEIDFVLKLWLGDFPTYTVIFVQITLIQSALRVVDYPIGKLVHAVGKMKYPSLTVSAVILIFPVSYLLLKTRHSPVSVYIASVLIWTIANVSDLYWASRYSGISKLMVIKRLYLNVLIGAIIMFIPPYYVSTMMAEGWVRLFVVCGISVIWSALVIYVWGLTPGMRNTILEKLRLKFNK